MDVGCMTSDPCTPTDVFHGESYEENWLQLLLPFFRLTICLQSNVGCLGTFDALIESYLFLFFSKFS